MAVSVQAMLAGVQVAGLDTGWPQASNCQLSFSRTPPAKNRNYKKNLSVSTSRIDRISKFESFYGKSVKIFNGFLSQSEAAQQFHNTYMLNVCPGSRNGGTNKCIVEVSWGHRTFESITQGRNWQALVEYGATLLYERSDSGHVIISLYPAYTETRKPLESSVTLAIWKDPACLNKPRFLKRNWNLFLAYMECTSLDGNPTAFQRIQVWCLRYFKHLIISDKWMPVKAAEDAKELLKYVFTVGLSGSIIYLVTLLTAKPTDNKSELEIKKMRAEVKSISAKLDRAKQKGTQLSTYKSAVNRLEKKTDILLKEVEKLKK